MIDYEKIEKACKWAQEKAVELNEAFKTKIVPFPHSNDCFILLLRWSYITDSYVFIAGYSLKNSKEISVSDYMRDFGGLTEQFIPTGARDD